MKLAHTFVSGFHLHKYPVSFVGGAKITISSFVWSFEELKEKRREYDT